MRYVNNLVRCAAFTGVAVYALYTVDHMWSIRMDVELASIQEENVNGTLGGCATDTECALAEQAALDAVAQERQLGAYGGGGRTMVAGK
jgi:hypothetical protein